MKTSKIKATATEKTVTTITLEIDGKKHNLTREDAKAVYDELSKVFGVKYDLKQKYWKASENRPVDSDVPWNFPTWPQFIPNNIPAPFTITY